MSNTPQTNKSIYNITIHQAKGLAIGDESQTKLQENFLDNTKDIAKETWYNYCQSVLKGRLVYHADVLFIHRRVHWLRHKQSNRMLQILLPPVSIDDPMNLDVLFEEVWNTGIISIILTGEPGIGKSSVLHHLMIAYAQRYLLKNTPIRWIPILVPLAFLEPNQTLIATLHAAFNESKVVNFTCEQIEVILNTFPCIIFFDGLDEIPSENRQKFIGSLRNFMRIYAQHRYIITCRSHDYRTSWELGPVLELLSLEKPELYAYIYRQLGRMRGRYFITRLSGPLSQNAQTPFVLQMMVGLAEQELVPKNWAHLFQVFSNYIFEKKYDTLVNKRVCERALSRLAYKMYTVATNKLSEILVRDTLLTQIKDWQEPYEWHDILTEILDIGFIYATQGNTFFAFQHRYWQAYFCAIHLIGEGHSSFDYSKIASNFWWQDVCLFASGLMEDVTPLILPLLQTDISITLRCIAETKSVSKDTSRQVLATSFSILEQTKSRDKQARIGYLLGRSGLITTNQLQTMLQNKNWFVRRAILKGVISQPLDYEKCQLLINYTQDSEWWVRTYIAQAIAINSNSELLVNAWYHTKSIIHTNQDVGRTTAWLTNYLDEDVSKAYSRLAPDQVLANAIIQARDTSVDPLISLLCDVTEDIYSEIFEIFQKIATPYSVFKLLTVANHQNWSNGFFYTINQILIHIETKLEQNHVNLSVEECSQIEKLITNHQDKQVRRFAIELFLKCCSESTKILIKIMKDNSEDLQLEIIKVSRTLSNIPIEIFQYAVTSKNALVYTTAIKSLTYLGIDGENMLWDAFRENPSHPQIFAELSKLLKDEMQQLHENILKPEFIATNVIHLFQKLVQLTFEKPTAEQVVEIDTYLIKTESKYLRFKQLISLCFDGVISPIKLADILRPPIENIVRNFITLFSSNEQIEKILVVSGQPIINVMIDILEKNQSPIEVEASLRFLGKIQAKNALNAIIKSLCYGNKTAIYVLVNEFGDISIPFLAKALPNTNQQSQILLLQTCRMINSLVAYQVIAFALSISNQTIRKEIQQLFLDSSSPIAIKALKKVLKTIKNPVSIIWILATLVCLEKFDYLEKVLTILGTSDVQSQHEMTMAISPLPESTSSFLLEIYKKQEIEKQLGCVRATVFLLHLPDSIKVLSLALGHKSPIIIEAARKIWIENIPNLEASSFLLPLIQSRDIKQAVEAIKLFGDKNIISCLQNLLNMLDHPNESIGEAVIYVLKSMLPQLLPQVSYLLPKFGHLGQKRIFDVIKGVKDSVVSYPFLWLCAYSIDIELQDRVWTALANLKEKAILGLDQCLKLTMNQTMQKIALEALLKLDDNIAVVTLVEPVVRIFLDDTNDLNILARQVIFMKFRHKAVPTLRRLYPQSNARQKKLIVEFGLKLFDK